MISSIPCWYTPEDRSRVVRRTVEAVRFGYQTVCGETNLEQTTTAVKESGTIQQIPLEVTVSE